MSFQIWQFSSPPEPDELIVVLATFWPMQNPIPGTTPALCDWCGCSVCKAPSTQEMIESRDGAPVHFCCPTCFLMGLPESLVTYRFCPPSP